MQMGRRSSLLCHHCVIVFIAIIASSLSPRRQNGLPIVWVPAKQALS